MIIFFYDYKKISRNDYLSYFHRTLVVSTRLSYPDDLFLRIDHGDAVHSTLIYV